MPFIVFKKIKIDCLIVEWMENKYNKYINEWLTVIGCEWVKNRGKEIVNCDVIFYVIHLNWKNVWVVNRFLFLLLLLFDRFFFHFNFIILEFLSSGLTYSLDDDGPVACACVSVSGKGRREPRCTRDCIHISHSSRRGAGGAGAIRTTYKTRAHFLLLLLHLLARLRSLYCTHTFSALQLFSYVPNACI